MRPNTSTPPRARPAARPPASATPNLRGLWLACVLIIAIVIAILAGLLSWVGGMNPPTAVLTAAGAFSATVFLLLSIIRYLSGTDG